MHCLLWALFKSTSYLTFIDFFSIKFFIHLYFLLISHSESSDYFLSSFYLLHFTSSFITRLTSSSLSLRSSLSLSPYLPLPLSLWSDLIWSDLIWSDLIWFDLVYRIRLQRWLPWENDTGIYWGEKHKPSMEFITGFISSIKSTSTLVRYYVFKRSRLPLSLSYPLGWALHSIEVFGESLWSWQKCQEESRCSSGRRHAYFKVSHRIISNRSHGPYLNFSYS